MFFVRAAAAGLTRTQETTMRCAITGALSYTGRYLAARLLAKGHDVLNLSRRATPIALAPLSQRQADALAADRVALDFDDVDAMARALEGCDVVYCSHWVRFVAGDGDPHAAAAAANGRLFEAAKRAGVAKVVLMSHTRTSTSSPFPYIAGKAKAEDLLREADLNYAIARPCGIFGDTPEESILMNNAAWVLRRVPVFLVAGDGDHVFQPVHVRDAAALLEALGDPATSGEERDACGPDAPTSLELFGALRDAVGGPGVVVPARGLLSTRAITALTRPIDWYTGDTLLDADDLDLLTSGLTRADDPGDPAIAGRRSLLAWIADRGPDLGRRYVSSVARYYR